MTYDVFGGTLSLYTTVNAEMLFVMYVADTIMRTRHRCVVR